MEGRPPIGDGGMNPRMVPLGELCEIDRSNVRADDPRAAGLPFLGVEHVVGGTGALDPGAKSRVGNRKSAAFRFDGRHVLYAKLRPYLNKVATPGFAGVCSTELVPLLPRDGVDRDFLACLLRSKEIVDFAMASATGSRMPRADMTALMAMPAPFPPIRRQREIAGVLKRAARIRRLCDRAKNCVRGFAPALFVETFGDPVENPMKWEVGELGEVADLAAGDPAPQDREAFSPDGPPFVRMQDVGRDHVNPALSVSTDRLNPVWLRENRLRVFARGAVLIPKSGASVNLNHRAMLAADAYVVSHLAVATPDRSRVDPAYLFWWSIHYDPRAHMQVTTLPSLKLATLARAKVMLPPLDIQRRFADTAEISSRAAIAANAAADSASTLTAALAARLIR